MLDATRTLLALDLGTQCGWALRFNGTTLWGTWKLKDHRYESAGLRFVRFASLLEDLRAKAPMHLICYEEVMGHKGTYAAHMYGGYVATMMQFCEHHSIPYRGVGVGQIKKHATGRGNATKEEMIDACKARLDIVAGNDNEADALWLLDYALKHK